MRQIADGMRYQANHGPGLVTTHTDGHQGPNLLVRVSATQEYYKQHYFALELRWEVLDEC